MCKAIQKHEMPHAGYWKVLVCLCARPNLEALHPKAAVLHLEEELLSQDVKLTQRMLMWPQPQLKSLHITVMTTVECIITESLCCWGGVSQEQLSKDEQFTRM